MKPSLTRDRSLILMNGLLEVLGPAQNGLDHLLRYADADDAGGVLYELHKILARVRLAQQIGRELRELRFPAGRDIDEAIRDAAIEYREERINAQEATV